MTNDDNTQDDKVRRTVVLLLSEGLASPSEAAELAGVSRQLVRHWAKGINWRRARKSRLTKEWRNNFKRI